MNPPTLLNGATWHSTDGLATFAYSYAFQPIVDITSGAVYSYEALLRGQEGQSAAQTLARVPAAEMHAFDRASRMRAVAFAAQLGLQSHLNLNVLPQSLLTSTTTITSTVAVAKHWQIPVEQLILELLEGEVIHDSRQIADILREYRSMGGHIAIDDFGSGYSGLNLLADFQPDFIKLDRNLVHEIEGNGPRQAIVRAIVQVCGDLGIDVIAEGIETRDEFQWLIEEDIHLFQGYFLARPAFERLPTIQLSK